MPRGVYERTEKHSRIISKALKGRKPWNTGTKGIRLSPKSEFKKGHLPKHTGKKRPEISGINHYNWQGGKTSKSAKIRNSLEYKLWRKSVFERDNYTCVWCGIRGGKLHADHIKPFAIFPELRFALDNGRTLCIPCHKTTETYLRNYKKT